MIAPIDTRVINASAGTPDTIFIDPLTGELSRGSISGVELSTLGGMPLLALNVSAEVVASSTINPPVGLYIHSAYGLVAVLYHRQRLVAISLYNYEDIAHGVLHLYPLPMMTGWLRTQIESQTMCIGYSMEPR